MIAADAADDRFIAFSRIRAVLPRRELLAEFVRRDFQTRYAGSFLGLLWTQLYPMLLWAVYLFVFSVIFPNRIAHFPVFLFVGIVLWNFFSTSILLSTTSITSNSPLVTKFVFPRELLVISVVSMAVIDLLMSQVILLIAAFASGAHPTITWLALPLIWLLLAALCTGLGLILASAAVYVRDVSFFTNVAVLLMMFISAVFYSARDVPNSVAWLMTSNPLAVAITAYRDAFLYATWPGLEAWLVLGVPAVVALWIGLDVFGRCEAGFLDAL